MNERVFGPVPSRRLGKSLGVNNIPAKTCSYSCIYCQLGRTTDFSIERREFYPVEEIVGEVIEALRRLKGEVDYVTYVPDGEPTLDVNLGREVEKIREKSEVKLAILTNGSLLFREDVRNDLMGFDVISVKIDAVKERIWRIINRPHKELRVKEVLGGVREFARTYSGTLITETMLIKGVNDRGESVSEVAEFLARIRPAKAYISIPTRPPAEPWVQGASEEALVAAHNIFEDKLGVGRVELLTGYEGPGFELVGDPVKAFLSTVSVHPMRIDYAYETLLKANLNPEETVEELLRKGEVLLVEHEGLKFIVRKLPSRCS